MSYCNNQWISDYTYEALFNTMNNLQAASLAGAHVAQSGDWLMVHGVILPEADTAIIHRVRRQNSVGEVPPIAPGGYSLRLYNDQNQQIADYPFTPEEDDEESGLLIAQVVPFVVDARALRVVRLSDNVLLAEQPISAAAPNISAVTVAGAPGPLGGPIDLSWTAGDPDGDTLNFDVLYSSDNGQSFTPVQLGVSGPSISIDRAELAGSNQAVLRVVASDGVQSAYADSAPFVLTALPPRPQITAPGDGTIVQWGSTVVLIGEAFDLQDGYLGGSDLAWRLQGGPLLGSGASVSVDDLPVGVNTIELEASNSAGETATVAITVIVQDDLEPAEATLSAAPGQIGWQVAPGAGVQTYDVTIANLGGGSLSWAASSDASWLTLSAASGSAPATLTVSGDPSGIPAGETRSATLTISASVGAATQQIQIPVTLSIGASYLSDPTQAPGASGNRLYLPMLWR